MQPLPTGAFPEEVAEETPVQSESEPKVLDPEEDLLCIAKTFSYLRESGKSRERQTLFWEVYGGTKLLGF